MSSITRIWVLLAMTALLLCSSVAGLPFIDSGGEQDLGTAEDTVELEFSSDYHMYHKVYVTNAESDVTEDEIKAWRPMEVDANLYPPRSVWSIDFGAENILFRENAELDVSDFSSGEYYIFTWGCTTQSSGGLAPGECDWRKTFYFEKEDSTPESECERFGYSCVHPSAVQGTGAEPRDYECSDAVLACYDVSNEEEINVLLSGHMGAGTNEGDRGLAPENTIMAFEIAQEVGIDSVEFDVRRADDGFVIIHDKNTERTTGESYTVADTSVSTLTSLSADADYTEIDSEYAVSEQEASGATIPSLEEALDYLQGTDFVLRIELKGDIRGDKELAREVYQEVQNRGLTDQAIFMSFEGECDMNWVSWDGSKRECSYPGLEAIEEVSNGQARTAVLWQAQKDPRNYGGLSNAAPYPPKDMLDEAEKKGFDIVVGRVEMTGAAGYEIGLKGFDMTPDDFAEEAKSRGMDYAFMGYDEAGDPYENLREQVTEYEVEWVSWNRIDSLVESIEEIETEEARG